MNLFQGKVDNNISARPLMEEVEERLRKKVEYKEFQLGLEKLNENYKMFESRVNHQLSVQKVEFQRLLERKAESREIELLKKNKADKDDVMAIYERMDQVESVAKQAVDQSDSEDSEKAPTEKDEEDIKINQAQQQMPEKNIQQSLHNDKQLTGFQLPADVVLQTQDKDTNENEAIKIIDFKDQASKTMKNLKQQVNVKIPKPNLEDDQVKFQESQSDITRFMTAGHKVETMYNNERPIVNPPSTMTQKSRRAGSDDSSSSKNPFKRKTSNKIEKLNTYMTQMFDDIGKRLNENRSQLIDLTDQTNLVVSSNKSNTSMLVKHNDYIENDLKAEIERIKTDLERLQRIDIKLNKELVQKPFNYMDRMKEGLEKEWVEAKKKLTDNNEKYMGKFVALETSVNKVLTDTATLMDQYKKKIGGIGKDLQSTKAMRDGIDIKLQANNSTLGQIQEKNAKDLDYVKKEVDNMKERLRSELSNLKEENHGFLRELQRNQLITRELQQEFMIILNEKKKVHEELIHHAYGKQQHQTQPGTTTAADQNLGATLLPQLKAQSSITNHETLSRQIKLGKLFSEKKSVDYAGVQANSSLIAQMKKGKINNITLNEDSLKYAQNPSREKYKTPQKERVSQTQRREKSDANRFDEELMRAQKAPKRSFLTYESSQDQNQVAEQHAIDAGSINLVTGNESNDFTRLHRLYGDQLQ